LVCNSTQIYKENDKTNSIIYVFFLLFRTKVSHFLVLRTSGVKPSHHWCYASAPDVRGVNTSIENEKIGCILPIALYVKVIC